MGNPHRLTCICLLALLTGVAAGALRAQEKDNSVGFDIFLFNQEDDGGNEIFNEAFAYVGVRASGRVKISNVLSLRPTATISTIETGRAVAAPSTVTNATSKITNATTASASATNVSLAGVADITPEESDWTFTPGAYFAYQPTYVSRGLDFSAKVELFKGNFAPYFSYGLRWDSLTGGNLRVAGIFGGRLRGTDIDDGFDRKLHNRVSHNFQLGFTQNLSPEWRLNSSLQYTRQDGYLATPNEQVTLYSGNTPVLFSDERLPNSRNRFQLNLRLRYSPLLGFAMGMDHSAYMDDWSISNFAIEPNVEGNFGLLEARWHLWYRFAYQDGTRFQRKKPRQAYKFQTDDPDLGTFRSHNGGVLFNFEMPDTGDMQWLLTVSANGMYRTDQIWGYGFLIGSEFGW